MVILCDLEKLFRVTLHSTFIPYFDTFVLFHLLIQFTFEFHVSYYLGIRAYGNSNPFDKLICSRILASGRIIIQICGCYRGDIKTNTILPNSHILGIRNISITSMFCYALSVLSSIFLFIFYLIVRIHRFEFISCLISA